MMRGVGVALLALLALIHLSSGLSCRCELSKCPQVQCPLGVEKDVCNCCDRCLKGLGEPCADIWNIKGSCAPGLVCSNPSTVPIPNQPPGVCIIPGKQTSY